MSRSKQFGLLVLASVALGVAAPAVAYAAGYGPNAVNGYAQGRCESYVRTKTDSINRNIDIQLAQIPRGGAGVRIYDQYCQVHWFGTDTVTTTAKQNLGTFNVPYPVGGKKFRLWVIGWYYGEGTQPDNYYNGYLYY